MDSIEEIKKYWDDRAKAHKESPKATTNDVYLRDIEVSTCIKALEQADKAGAKTVADVGCGNGYSTLQLAQRFPDMTFHGYDYSDSMIENAIKSKESMGIENIDFAVYDILSGPLDEAYDFICTDRCLINLSTWELQQQGLANLHASLNVGGTYLMIENFLEGQNNFNSVRRDFDLPEIPVRDHNQFFDRNEFEDFVQHKFDVTKRENISSAYYLVSRVIYSAICQKTGTTPDYLDDHHELASRLPYLGDFGPTVSYTLGKK